MNVENVEYDTHTNTQKKFVSIVKNTILKVNKFVEDALEDIVQN